MTIPNEKAFDISIAQNFKVKSVMHLTRVSTRNAPKRKPTHFELRNKKKTIHATYTVEELQRERERAKEAETGIVMDGNDNRGNIFDFGMRDEGE